MKPKKRPTSNNPTVPGWQKVVNVLTIGLTSIGILISAENPEITKIQVTPPAAFEFVRSLEEGREMSCVTCNKCGYPHLDLGDFALKPHKKHFCGNCGNDSIWSPDPIVSTELDPKNWTGT